MNMNNYNTIRSLSATNNAKSSGFSRYSHTGLGACPICDRTDSRCDRSGDFIHCRTASPSETISGYRSIRRELTAIGCSVWVEERESQKRRSPEEIAAWVEQKKRSEQQRKTREIESRKALAREPEKLDREYEILYRENGLSAEHLADIERRGLNRADIERIGCYTLNGGLYLPVRDLDGLRVGAQYKITGRGYRWDREGRIHTKLDGEQPLTFWGNRTNPVRVVFVEGLGFKPYITSIRNPSDLVIGAAGGMFGSSPAQIERVLELYPGTELVLMADGDAVFNPNIKNQYQKLFELVAANDRQISIGWWGQFNKSDGDIDEIAIDTEIEYIEVADFGRMTAMGLAYKETTKQIDRVSGKKIERSEQFLSAFGLPRNRAFTYVSSGVGTGKTQQLEPVISAWEKLNPDCRTIVIGYRNALLDQMCDRLKIDSYRTGYGMQAAAIANHKRLAIVADSIGQLSLSDIPANSLVIIDEVDAVVRHIAQHQTMGSRGAGIQAHVANILDRVLVSGGAVLALEDSITSNTVTGLADLTGDKYESDLILNKYNRFNWDVRIGWQNPDKFTESIIARLMAGERVVTLATSQKFGESLQRIVEARLPELAGKVRRIDSKTLDKQRALMADPVGFLRANPTNLLILSPTVESGFSIDDGGVDPLFDRVVLWAGNLDPRSHLQMLARYRSNCPRDIYCSKRGAEAASEEGRNAHNLLKKSLAVANETALEQGFGKIKNNNIGEVWNRLESEYKARAAISSVYLYEFLRHELIEDGHQVSVVDWETASAEYCQEHGIQIDWDTRSELAEMRTLIDDELAKLLLDADGTQMSEITANLVKRSSHVSYETKIVAEKALLHHRLPEAELSYEFIRECVVERRGEYLRQLELAYLIDKLDLSKAIDKEQFSRQIENPHIIYSRVPKNSQRARLLHPIAAEIADLASGREYMADDAAIAKIANYLRSNSYQFWLLFGFTSREASTDVLGRVANGDAHLAGKIIKRLGWKTRRVRQTRIDGKRIGVYAIVNSNCPHRQLVTAALDRRYSQTIASAAGIKIERHVDFKDKDLLLKSTCQSDPIAPEANQQAEYMDRVLTEIAEALELSIGHYEFISDILAIYPIEQVRAAAKLLPRDRREKLAI